MGKIVRFACVFITVIITAAMFALYQQTGSESHLFVTGYGVGVLFMMILDMISGS